MGTEGCFSLHGVRWVGVGGLLGLSRGLHPRTLTSFSSLDRRKEDQGDDCHQVARMIVEGCLSLHRVLLNRRGGLFGPS